MSGTSSSTSWSVLLSELMTADPDAVVPNEAIFHRKFKETCTKHKETQTNRLLNAFQRDHRKIIIYVNALSQSTAWTETNPSSVFWTGALQVVVYAFKTKQKDRLFTKYLSKLNDTVPDIDIKRLVLFPNEEDVQKPLQMIFKEFMGLYTMLLQVLDTKQDVDEKSFSNKVATVREKNIVLKQEWGEAVEAAQIAQRLAELEASHRSYSTFEAASSVGTVPPRATTLHFVFSARLGRGMSGEVYSVKEKSHKQLFAVKEIKLGQDRYKPSLLELFENEASILLELSHDHIAQLHYSVIEEKCLKLFMTPVADCNLLEYMKGCSEKRTSVGDMSCLTSWFGCLTAALVYAHHRKIAHKDIKPANILIKDRGKERRVFLTDFGCAEIFEDDFDKLKAAQKSDKNGTRMYWPPELDLKHTSSKRDTLSYKRDVWSLGCVFSEMLTIRQNRALDDFYDCRSNNGNGHAFRDNLEIIEKWLDDITKEDQIAEALCGQILSMLHPKPERRTSALNVKRAWQYDPHGSDLFCESCV